MNKMRAAIAAVALGIAGLAALAFLLTAHAPHQFARSSLGDLFAVRKLPTDVTYDLMDMGVVDVNGDDRLDIFTSNHNSRQQLWVADGRGGYTDMLTEYGLDQNLEFPGLEISPREPEVSEPGIYMYWKERNENSQFTLVIRTHRIKEIGRLDAALITYSSIHNFKGPGFAIQRPVLVPDSSGKSSETIMKIATDQDGKMEVEIGSPGLPVQIRLDESIPLTNVFVGEQKVSPRSHEFSFSFQDRHGMAWFDYNNDGRLDVFISRGAIGGTLRNLPTTVQQNIHDELQVSELGNKRYHDISSAVGFDKRGCSARKAVWVDYDRDGATDLFVNCQDRGSVKGDYPKQLYRQVQGGKFIDVAADVGLALPDHEIIDLVWFDVDGDGYLDMVTYEDKGFFLYRNMGGKKFSQEFIGRPKFVRADRPQLKGTSDEYWFVDGKLAVADFRGNGILDVFCASKTGNILLQNDGKGSFTLVDPASVGLPDKSATAHWVDFNGDGLMDMYAVPQGLFRQRPDHRFERTGLLELPPQRYMAAISTWADLDNHGKPDLLLALLENFSLWKWWEKLYRTSEDRFAWKLVSLRNLSSDNHRLQVRLVGKAGNPQAIGAQVHLETEDGLQTQVVGLNDGAFFSQGHYRLYFGLGSRARAKTLKIQWPDGENQEIRDLDGDRLYVITQGREFSR